MLYFSTNLGLKQAQTQPNSHKRINGTRVRCDHLKRTIQHGTEKPLSKSKAPSRLPTGITGCPGCPRHYWLWQSSPCHIQTCSTGFRSTAGAHGQVAGLWLGWVQELQTVSEVLSQYHCLLGQGRRADMCTWKVCELCRSHIQTVHLVWNLHSRILHSTDPHAASVMECSDTELANSVLKVNVRWRDCSYFTNCCCPCNVCDHSGDDEIGFLVW